MSDLKAGQQWWRVEFVEGEIVRLDVYAPTIPMGIMARVLGQLFTRWIYDRNRVLDDPTSEYNLGIMHQAFMDGMLDTIYNEDPVAKELHAKYDKKPINQA